MHQSSWAFVRTMKLSLTIWANKYEAEHGNERCKFFHDHIIAWQLKPKPYRETDFE